MSDKPYIIHEKSGLLTIRDPMVLVVGDTYYLTGTQPPYWKGINDGVHLWSSKDLKEFTYHGIILKRDDMPEDMWCRDRFWAPELFNGGDGWFYLTFNCRNESEEYKHTHSIGIARAKNITGPYEIMTKNHSLTEFTPGDNDASLFKDDDNKVYLCCNEKDNLLIYPINLQDAALGDMQIVALKGNEGEWDSIGVEGPCIVKRHGIYFHWYSSWTNGYEAGILTSKSINGPWTKSKDNPIFGENDIWYKAGHNHSFTGLDGKDYIIFHAFLKDENEEKKERLFIRRVDYNPDGSVIVYE